LKKQNCASSLFMSTKLFVGGVSWDTNDDGLRDAFSPFGVIESVRIMTDRETGRSRGFGFVEFQTAEAAESALKAMDGSELDGRLLRVDFAAEKPEGGFGGGGRGRDGGGFGGGRGGGRGGFRGGRGGGGFRGGDRFDRSDRFDRGDRNDDENGGGDFENRRGGRGGFGGGGGGYGGGGRGGGGYGGGRGGGGYGGGGRGGGGRGGRGRDQSPPSYNRRDNFNE